MADATSYWRTLTAQCRSMVGNFNDLTTSQDMQAQDADLAAAAAAAANAAGRTDLTEADFVNAAAAINQILFAFNTGTPTQKSYIYKLL